MLLANVLIYASFYLTFFFLCLIHVQIDVLLIQAAWWFSRLDLAKLLRSPRITKAHMCADCCDVPQMCSKNSADQAQTQKSSSESGCLGQTNAHLYLYLYQLVISAIYTKDMYKMIYPCTYV